LKKIAEEKLSAFVKSLQKIGGLAKIKSPLTKSRSPELQLGARAVLLFLEKLQLERRGPSEENKEDPLLEQLEKLLQAKEEPIFRGLSKFFDEAQSFLSPLCDLKEFKSACIQSLAPIYAYLEKI